MKFSNTNLITEEVKLDERQKAIIGEISTDCIRLWYTLNFTVTIFAAVFVLSSMIPVGRTFVMAVLAVYFAITFLCLSVFNIKSAAKGVLTEFMGVKLNGRGIGAMVLTYIVGIGMLVREYMAGNSFISHFGTEGIIFFGIVFAVGIVYDIILLYCRKKNKSVNEENEEE